MSDYRRLIAYVYEYEGKEKGKNIGFAKLEIKHGQCRIQVSVKRVYVGGNAIGVYLLGRKGQKTCLGHLFIRNGAGEFRTAIDASSVEGTGNPIDAYYGLAVHDVKDPWRSYQTFWDDVEPEHSEPLPEPLEPKAEKEPATEPDSYMAQEILPDSKSVKAEALEPKEEEEADVFHFLRETETEKTDPQELWEELRKEYPKMQPFDYDGGCEVLTIRPDDIGRLPRECWVYGNNSFVLHGYYNYRHLILVRLDQTDGPPRFLLGVPGHCYSSEKYMASMFGFPNFVLSKKQPPKDDRFGYWYVDIAMDRSWNK